MPLKTTIAVEALSQPPECYDIARDTHRLGCFEWSVEPPFRCVTCGEPMQGRGADTYWRQRFAALWQVVSLVAFYIEAQRRCD